VLRGFFFFFFFHEDTDNKAEISTDLYFSFNLYGSRFIYFKDIEKLSTCNNNYYNITVAGMIGNRTNRLDNLEMQAICCINTRGHIISLSYVSDNYCNNIYFFQKDEKGFAALPMFARDQRFEFPPKVNNVLCKMFP
jgi:hypothetical protein